MSISVDHLRCKNCEKEFHLLGNESIEVGCIACGWLDLELLEVYFVEKV